MLPDELTGLGRADDAPKLGRVGAPGQPPISPEEYFVLSRCDGKTSIRQICLLLSGTLTEQRVVEMLTRLSQIGAIQVGQGHGHGPAAVHASSSSPAQAIGPRASRAGVGVVERHRTPQSVESASREHIVGGFRTTGPSAARATVPTREPVARDSGREIVGAPLRDADDGPCDLSDAEKRRIEELFRSLRTATHFQLLDAKPDTLPRDLKRNYFRLSKEFHPDRFYTKQLGGYREKLNVIFTKISQAFHVLSDDGKRATYLLELKSRNIPPA